VDRVLPGKALDLLDEVATAVSIRRKEILEPSDVEDVISEKTKVPVQKAEGKEAERLIHLEEILHKRIIGQEEAVKAVAGALRRARTIERDTKKPIGSFLFLGPTGVGKTETAKTLASFYFGSEEKIIRLDLSEFQEASSINRLIGAAPGQEGFEEGGEFTEKVRNNPFSLVLLDELEKAHYKIQEAFLPVLDEGSLEDASGRKIIFTNTIIIATSNAGAEFIRESIQQNKPIEQTKTELLEKLQKEGIYKPEFLNRFDDIVVYKPLTKDEVGQVVGLVIDSLATRLAKQDIKLNVDQQGLSLIIERGYDKIYGARPIRRLVADELEEPIAQKILSGEIKKGSLVNISSAESKFVISS
jgi:ATP-dependent Clp protease ATP-binding subunit ClpB